MIGGPLDPANVRNYAPNFTPAGARFMLETCILRRVNLDADTAMLLREIGKRDKPDWEPRPRSEIERARWISRGIEAPPPRVKPAEPAPETLVESSEVDLGDIDGAEEVPL